MSHNVGQQTNGQSPQRGPTNRERRVRAIEEKREGSSRRRAGRNRNSVLAAQAAQVAAAVGQPAANGNVGGAKLDLPAGFGKLETFFQCW